MTRSLTRLAAAAVLLSSLAHAQVDVPWVDNFSPPATVGRIALAVDTDTNGGAVAAYGASSGSVQSLLAEDLVVRRLGENGDREWSMTQPLTVQNYTGLLAREFFNQLAVDDDGTVAFAVAAADAVRVRLLEPNGALRWTRAIPPVLAPHVTVLGLGFLPSGDPIVVTHEDEFLITQSTRQISLMRLDASTGATVWRVDLPAVQAPAFSSNASGDSALLVASGQGYSVMRYDANGALAASTPLSLPLAAWHGRSIDLDDTGRVVAVHSDHGLSFREAVTSIDPAGVVEWTTILQFGGPGAVLANGDYLRTIATYGEPLLRVRRDGTTPASVAPPSSAALYATIAALPDGGFLATGWAEPGSAPNESFARRYDAAEQLAWEMDFTPPAFRRAEVEAFALDARDNPIVTTTLRDSQLAYVGARTLKLVEGGDPGVGYCSPAVANSTGAPATIRGAGSDVVTRDNLTLLLGDLPTGSAVLALAARSTGLVPNAGGSQGTLCLGGAIGRYVGPGQVRRADAAGRASLQLDLGALPAPTGLRPAVVGETWSFQAWYRDANPQPTSNFTSATSVTMR